nr:MAG TPA: hypothetical protein [Caudoviricetes sp.]
MIYVIYIIITIYNCMELLQCELKQLHLYILQTKQVVTRE